MKYLALLFLLLAGSPAGAQTYCITTPDGTIGAAGFGACPTGGPAGPAGPAGPQGPVGPQGPAGGSTRIVMTGPTTFYLNGSSGCDLATDPGCTAAGDGTSAHPWKTRQFAYRTVRSLYDGNDQQVVFQFQSGVDTSAFTADGALFGTTKYPIFQGDCATPTNTLITPANNNNGGGYGFGVNNNSNVALRCLKVGRIPSYWDDVLSIGYGSTIVIKDSFIFGDAGGDANGQFNDMTINAGGRVVVDIDATGHGGYRKEATSIGKTGASYSNGSTTINISSGTTGLLKFMGVVCGGCGPANYVASVSGGSITTNQPMQGGSSNETIIFRYGAQTHIDVGETGKIVFQNNTVPGLVNNTIVGEPFYYQSFLFADLVGLFNGQGVGWIGPARGKKFDVRGNSIILVGGSPPGSNLPGSVAGTTSTGAQIQ